MIGHISTEVQEWLRNKSLGIQCIIYMPGSDTKTPSCPHLGRSTAGKKYLQRQAPMFTCMRLIAHLVRGVFLYKMQLQQVSGCWYSWSDKKTKFATKPPQVTGYESGCWYSTTKPHMGRVFIAISPKLFSPSSSLIHDCDKYCSSAQGWFHG